MTYRKFKGDYLFNGYQLLPGSPVLITDDFGKVEAVLPEADAGDNIEVFEGLICPGLVNCHCHLELSHMKGLIPEKTGLVDFLIGVIRQRNSGTDLIQEAILRAEMEMFNNGIVAVGDICNTTHTLLQKKQQRLAYRNFIEALGFVAATAGNRFDDALKIYAEFRDHLPGSNAYSIVPHAPYSVSEKLFGLIAGFPGNELLAIHNQEDEAENELYRYGTGAFHRLYQTLGIDASGFIATGKSSLLSYLPYFAPAQSIVLVHNVATNAADLAACKAMKNDFPELYFCVCPNTNLYISGKLPDIPLFIANELSIVVGTDSLASNHQLSILEELKTLQLHFPELSAETLLRWATSNGAKALQLESRWGSFEHGKKPGIVLIDNMEDGKMSSQSRAQRIL